MKLSKVFWLLICASLAHGILIIFLTRKAENKDESIIINRPEVKESFYQELQPTYYYGEASYYDRTYCEKYNPSCITASGEKFNDTAFTCACANWFRLGSTLKVSYAGNEVAVKCNDRGNFESKGRILDLSQASFKVLAPLSKGIIPIKVEVIK